MKHGSNRSEDGVYLIEALIASLVGCTLLLAAYTQVAALYRQGTTNENEILATNMAQQLIDNARNCSYGTLQGYAGTGWQTVPFYSSTTNALYPRALLRNPGETYSSDAANRLFNGTVQERLTSLPNSAGTVLKLEVKITWADQRGNGHEYDASTIVSANGIHN